MYVPLVFCFISPESLVSIRVPRCYNAHSLLGLAIGLLEVSFGFARTVPAIRQ